MQRSKCLHVAFGVHWQQYLWAAIYGLPAIQNDVAHSVVAIQLDSVKLSQLDGVGVPNGGHARAHIEPETMIKGIIGETLRPGFIYSR